MLQSTGLQRVGHDWATNTFLSPLFSSYLAISSQNTPPCSEIKRRRRLSWASLGSLGPLICLAFGLISAYYSERERTFRVIFCLLLLLSAGNKKFFAMNVMFLKHLNIEHTFCMFWNRFNWINIKWPEKARHLDKLGKFELRVAGVAWYWVSRTNLMPSCKLFFLE